MTSEDTSGMNENGRIAFGEDTGRERGWDVQEKRCGRACQGRGRGEGQGIVAPGQVGEARGRMTRCGEHVHLRV